MNAASLVMREPALAMLMGALPQGNNFGFGDDYPGMGFGGHRMGYGGVPLVGPGVGFGAAAQDQLVEASKYL